MEGPRPLVNRAPRHRKCHPCARVAAPVPASQLIRIPRRVLHPGHCGYDPGGGAAPLSAPVQYDLCPGWGPAPRHCGGSAPRSRPSRHTRAGPRRVLLGHCGYDRVGEGPQRRRTPKYDLCPGWLRRPGALRYRPRVAAASAAARPARGASSWGTAGRGESTAGAQSIRSLPQMARSTRGTVGIVLPPKPPPQSGGQPNTRPSGHVGYNRHGEGGRTAGALVNTISAPDGSTDPGHCGYRPYVAAISPAQEPVDPRGPEGRAGGVGPARYPWPPSDRHSGSESCPPIPSLPQFAPRTAPAARPAAETSLSPTSERLSTGNRFMRGTARIPCGAPRVQDPGHPPSRAGAVTVAFSDRLRPPRPS
jgi:hypothetical protein